MWSEDLYRKIGPIFHWGIICWSVHRSVVAATTSRAQVQTRVSVSSYRNDGLCKASLRCSIVLARYLWYLRASVATWCDYLSPTFRYSLLEVQKSAASDPALRGLLSLSQFIQLVLLHPLPNLSNIAFDHQLSKYYEGNDCCLKFTIRIYVPIYNIFISYT